MLIDRVFFARIVCSAPIYRSLLCDGVDGAVQLALLLLLLLLLTPYPPWQSVNSRDQLEVLVDPIALIGDCVRVTGPPPRRRRESIIPPPPADPTARWTPKSEVENRSEKVALTVAK